MGKKVVLAGGSGFLGQSVAEFLAAHGYEVVILTRGKSSMEDRIKYIHWDAVQINDWVSELEGCYAVNPVTNKQFMATLRKAMGKSWNPPAPAPFVWLGAYLLMKTEPSLALTGRNCLPEKLLDSGFTFHYSDLETTLKELV
ncbi:DUF1731 domain-containing protein [Peribacillus cavernae]|uniref:DUF1731 domain-containing protein n=1 Tax=Peribacillus cavernae TaxID=1674310 RepID=A0A3S0VVU8_9BACI|nr:DUF1731 domain-containing protein [Peribacillus cavernae]MDQ0219820.1 NAD dependent epimerase/dehydratase family enzyme [Peribacillus cavernae]RUQ27211.1 DUF1731 domain-containing protein [Peribacillus cavernae]